MLHPKSDKALLYHRFLANCERELAFHAARQGERPLSSVFYGGGTPSRLGFELLDALHDAVKHHFVLTPDCEVSVEVNPEDAVPEFLDNLKHFGVNRISLGVQTFHNASLRAIRRVHTAERALESIASAPVFSGGLSLDLILGLPYQTAHTLEIDLQHIRQLAPDHVALYLLERDLPIPLDKSCSAFPMPDDDQQADFYEHASKVLSQLGFEAYELSNFCKPGFACRHNLLYWNCGDYLAVGPSAVGRVSLDYYCNFSGLGDWSEAVASVGHGMERQETWSEQRLLQERLVQGMRLSQGIPRGWLSARHLSELNACLDNGLLVEQGDRLLLSLKGRLLGNEVFQVFVDP